jgi:hypothetical protein
MRYFGAPFVTQPFPKRGILKSMEAIEVSYDPYKEDDGYGMARICV